jgi:hypothetical protein
MLLARARYEDVDRNEIGRGFVSSARGRKPPVRIPTQRVLARLAYIRSGNEDVRSSWVYGVL